VLLYWFHFLNKFLYAYFILTGILHLSRACSELNFNLFLFIILYKSLFLFKKVLLSFNLYFFFQKYHNLVIFCYKPGKLIVILLVNKG